MPSMVSYKRVSGDIEEAERIARLLQEEVNTNFPELQRNIPELTARLMLVKKWNDIVTGLKELAEEATPAAAPAPASPATAVGADAVAKQADEGGDAKVSRATSKKA